LRQPATNNKNALTCGNASSESEGHCEEVTPGVKGEGGTANKVDERGRYKRQKVDNKYAPRVIIVGDQANVYESDSNDSNEFQRTNPHWEGRWAGHLFLPFPSLDHLDIADQSFENDESESCAEDTSDESDVEEEETVLPESRSFLPSIRILIKYLALLLQEAFDDTDEHEYSSESSNITIVPHIPMQPARIQTKNTSMSDAPKPQRNNEYTQQLFLHVSLSRPIYLPAPSVDSFISSISQCIKTVLSVSKNNSNSKCNGRLFHLNPHDAAIFTNDDQSRSFLTIPITGESTQWIKRVLLPPIDSTMKRFGLKSYYSEEGERCVLHVSVASVKGNIIKRIAEARNRYAGVTDIDSNELRSISLLGCKQILSDGALAEMESTLKSVPSSIPIRFDRVQCQFGKVKEVSIKL
jgi:hypothetical protein